jgi:undecaprenyl diphosphate synthase
MNKKIHVGIIMDGNGRWATARGLPRTLGHTAGATAIRPIVQSATDLGIGTLTLFAFSSDNWRRPATEVSALMALFGDTLQAEAARMRESECRLTFIGRRDRLEPRLLATMEDAEHATVAGTRVHVRIALDYSARHEIAQAALRLALQPEPSVDAFAAHISPTLDSGQRVSDVDLLIRTAGEQRLSDFLLWECAYAELVFTDRLWPDFSTDDLAAAVTDFYRRERRFGGLPPNQTTYRLEPPATAVASFLLPSSESLVAGTP